MKSLLVLLALSLTLLTFATTAVAGDKLPGSKSYQMVNRNGSDAGHVATSSDGNSITYFPGDGSTPITYDWDPGDFRYENAARNDWFEFFSWPQKVWEHGYGTAAAGTTGTYTSEIMTEDPL